MIEAVAVYGLIALIGLIIAWGTYEVATMPPDDDRWDAMADTNDPMGRWWRYR